MTITNAEICEKLKKELIALLSEGSPRISEAGSRKHTLL
jgi:hypothetical protein